MVATIKLDVNRAGRETTDFPSVCERCLPDNAYVQMLKSNHDAECKLCTRPFTLFTFKADRTSRQKKTAICLTCSRLKNCCQVCMLDLSFGLPLAVRDAALKMVAPGPRSEINREYFAQAHEKAIEEGRGPVEEAYKDTNSKAVELLQRLANSDTYRKRTTLREEDVPAGEGSSRSGGDGKAGPVRTRDGKLREVVSRPGGGLRTARSKVVSPEDLKPPADPNVVSLFVTGIEDDLPEYHIRNFFANFGPLRSVVCSHRAHCAFINYKDRASAEAAAEACQGIAIVDGRSLRVRWGKPKTLDTMDREQRVANVREGRALRRAIVGSTGGDRSGGKGKERGEVEGGEGEEGGIIPPPPPGKESVQYASLAGE